MASTIKQRLRRFNGTDYDTIHLETETGAISDYTYPSNPNLLDNWYFVGGGSQQGGGQFPINQRGQIAYTGGGAYTIDRWRLIGSDPTVVVNGDYLTFIGNSSKPGIRQYLTLDGYSALAGRDVTISVLLADNIFRTATGRIRATETGVWQIGTSFDEFWVGVEYIRSSIWLLAITSTQTVDIVAVKLELGSYQTLAHQDANGNWVLNEIPNYQQELAKCQRYVIELNPYGWTDAVIGTAIGYSATEATCLIPLPVTMQPTENYTYSMYGSWCLSQGSSGRRFPITSHIHGDTYDGMTGNCFVCTVGVASGLADGTYYMIRSNDDSSARMLIDSEIT